jgi:hypothetical protein
MMPRWVGTRYWSMGITVGIFVHQGYEHWAALTIYNVDE